MQRFSKSILCFAAVCFITVSLAGGAAAAKRTRCALGTGPSGVVNYILGAGMADLVNKNSSTVEITAQTTSGSTENVNLVQAGEIQFGFSMYDVAYFAYLGDREYKGKPKADNVRLALMGHMCYNTPVVWADSPFKTIGDLKGETIPSALGVSSFLLDSASYKPWGITLVREKCPVLTYSEQTTAMKDGVLKVANYNTGIPASTILDLATAKPIRILGQTEDSIARILEEHPYWRRAVLPAKTYPGQDEELVCLGYLISIIVNKDTPDEAVRELMRACFDNDLSNVHPEGRFYNAGNAANYEANPGLPYHPAAEAFLKERGILK